MSVSGRDRRDRPRPAVIAYDAAGNRSAKTINFTNRWVGVLAGTRPSPAGRACLRLRAGRPPCPSGAATYTPRLQRSSLTKTNQGEAQCH